MVTLKHKRGTAARWLTVNPILGNGEIGYEKDTGRFKIGNGVDVWADLKYYPYGPLENITSISTPNTIQMNTAYTGGSTAEGQLAWNQTERTLEFRMGGNNVTQQIGQEQLILVKHADNAGLIEGKVVYVTGSDGSNTTVRYAQGNSEAASSETIGVMTESVSGGGKAFATTFGIVHDINTSALTEGAIVWLDPTVAGGMTTTKPLAPNHAVQVGYCIRQHAVNGHLFVRPQNGYELYELHDVSITSPAADQILTRNKDNTLWVNQSASSAGLVTITDAQNITGNKTFGGNVIVSGDFTVNGTTTNLNSTNLVIEDKNIVLADVATPTDTTANGAGITIKGATDKTFNWVSSTGLFTASNGISAPSLTINGISNAHTPAGMVSQFAGSTAPTGWLMCTGTAISRTTYATLFAVIGTTYGAGDGSTTFNLPDLRGRVPVGVDAGSGRVGSYNLIGQSSGNEYNTHQHFTLSSNDGANIYTTASGYTVNGSTPASRVITATRYQGAGGGTTAATRQDATYDATINIMQPYLMVNYIIKY